jgi:ABC-type maltose transport system permease subunit
VTQSLVKCSTEESFEIHKKLCNVICVEGNSNVASAIMCDKYHTRLKNANNPVVILAITSVIMMIILTSIGWFLSRWFKIYRHKLELYQHLLVDFIPDKISEVAVKYQPSLEIIDDCITEE